MDLAVLGDTMSDVIKELKTTGLSSDSHQLDSVSKHLEKTLNVIAEMNSNQNPTLEQAKQLKSLTNELSSLLEEDHLSKDGIAKKIFISIKSGLVRSVSNRDKVIEKIMSMAEKLEGFASRLSEEGRMNKGKELAIRLSEEGRKNKGKELAIRLSDDDVLGEREPIGRITQKEDIIQRLILLRNKNDVLVVAIMGIAGIGKTRLAQLVFEDERVKNHFYSLIWVHGTHEAFDVESIAKRVASKLPYLLVLDDLIIEPRDESFTKLLLNLTDAGLSDGAILVTTRSSLAANTTATKVTPYALQGLNEEESWSLFLQILQGRESAIDSRNVLQHIRRKIVGQCRGVPLAIITLAKLTLLHSRGSQVVEAKVAELKEEFLLKLKSIYHDDLPTPQKRCFDYCALFPEDYLIDPDRLIHLWMGEGFLKPWKTSHSPEEHGQKYFSDFRRNSIFEDVKEDECGVVRSCRMNRLMHDLASKVTADENITVDLDGKKIHDGVLRASINFSLDVSRRIPYSLFEKAKKLRTLLLLAKTQLRLPHELKMRSLACEEIFMSFNGLRILDLHDLGIKIVPSSIGDLKQLRCLDLSQNSMEKLPGSITKLIYLQTLKLSQCHVLKELPKHLEDLHSLRHLDIEGCFNLTHMPPRIKNLTSLQTLSQFVVSENYHMGGLGELTDLNNLRGHLEILHLERLNFSTSSDTKAVYLKYKENLQRLTLRWDHDEEEKDKEGGSHHKIDDDKDKKSLELLEPHPELRVLYVVGYRSHKFSNWLPSLHHLVKFSLYNCPRYQFLPPLDLLRSLEILELQRLYSLEFIAENSDNPTSDTDNPRLFPSLKELTISDCPSLRSWWKTEKTGKDIPFFTCISKLLIQYCPVLTCMPLYPWLDKELVLVGSSVKPLQDTIDYRKREAAFYPFSKLKSMLIASVKEHLPLDKWLKYFISLENLRIRECPHLEFLSFKHSRSLQSLTIENCPKLDVDSSRTKWEGLKNLRSLTIREIPNLNSLPWGFNYVTSLQDLRLHNCPELTSLHERMGNLTLLDRLEITECDKLASLPEGMKMLKSLHTLIILNCILLLPRCQPETGNDWPQIAHIKNKVVKETSLDL